MDLVRTRWFPPRCTGIDAALILRPEVCESVRRLARWFPVPLTGAEQVLRRDKYHGPTRKADTSDLSPCIQSVLVRDEYLRNEIRWRPGC